VSRPIDRLYLTEACPEPLRDDLLAMLDEIIDMRRTIEDQAGLIHKLAKVLREQEILTTDECEVFEPTRDEGGAT
jgi:hypothetical protein